MDKMDSLKPAEEMCAALEQELKLAGIPVPTIKESCEQALQEHAARKALREIGRRQELAKLQAEFETLEHGVVPASEESLNRLAEQIRESYAELETLAAEHIGSPEHTLALDCLKALIREYGVQEQELASRKD